MEKRLNNGLQIVRASACIMIVVHHLLGQYWNIKTDLGECAVTIFFLLSAFLAGGKENCSWNSKNSIWRESAALVKKKVRKFYFLYFISVMMTFPIYIFSYAQRKITRMDILQLAIILVCCLCLIQSWIPSSDFYYGFNGVAWFLSAIVFAYFLEPFMRRRIEKLESGRKKIWMMIALFLILIVITLLFQNSEFEIALLYINPIPRAMEYGIGFLAGNLAAEYSKTENSNIIIDQTMAEALVIVLMFLALWVKVPAAWSDLVWYIPFSLLLIVVFKNTQGGYIKKKLSNGFVFKIAEISLTIYLLHQVIIRYVYIFNKYILKADSCVGTILSVVLIIITVSVYEWYANRKKKRK